MPLKCVPFQHAWITDEKLDLKAIYKRPLVDNFGDPVDRNRQPNRGPMLWDTTTPLPVRRHHSWAAKGFVYITLADQESLIAAAPTLRAAGLNPADYANQDRRHRSPWNYQLWQETEQQEAADELADLRVLVAEFGADAVERIKQREQPGFRLPAELRQTAQDGPGATTGEETAKPRRRRRKAAVAAPEPAPVAT